MENKVNYKIITIILSWCGLIIMSSMYFTIPLIPHFSNIFNISHDFAVWTTTIFCVFFAITCLVSGPISDKYGRKKVIITGIFLLAIITPLVGLFNNFYWVLALRAFEGMAAALFSPVALAYIQENFPQNIKITTTGFLITGFMMAGIVGQVISSFIIQYLSWNYIFYIGGIFYILTIFLVLFFLPQDKSHNLNSNVLESIKKMKSLLKIKSLILCYIVDIMFLMTMMAMYTALGFHLTGQFGLNDSEILQIRAIGIIGMFLATVSGYFVKRIGIFTVLIGGLALSSISLILIGFINNLTILILLTVIIVGGIAFSTPSLISLIGQIGGEARGSALSLHTVILFIGAGIGPVIAIQLLNIGYNFLPFLVMGVLLLIGVILSYFIKNIMN